MASVGLRFILDKEPDCVKCDFCYIEFFNWNKDKFSLDRYYKRLLNYYFFRPTILKKPLITRFTTLFKPLIITKRDKYPLSILRSPSLPPLPPLVPFSLIPPFLLVPLPLAPLPPAPLSLIPPLLASFYRATSPPPPTYKPKTYLTIHNLFIRYAPLYRITKQYTLLPAKPMSIDNFYKKFGKNKTIEK